MTMALDKNTQSYGFGIAGMGSKDNTQDSSVNFNKTFMRGRNSLHENQFRNNSLSMSKTLRINNDSRAAMNQQSEKSSFSHRKRSVFNQGQTLDSGKELMARAKQKIGITHKNSVTKIMKPKLSENFFRASSIGQMYKF